MSRYERFTDTAGEVGGPDAGPGEEHDFDGLEHENDRWYDQRYEVKHPIRQSLRLAAVIVALVVIHWSLTQYAPAVSFLEPIVGADALWGLSQVLVFVIGFMLFLVVRLGGKLYFTYRQQRYLSAIFIRFQ